MPDLGTAQLDLHVASLAPMLVFADSLTSDGLLADLRRMYSFVHTYSPILGRRRRRARRGAASSRATDDVSR